MTTKTLKRRRRGAFDDGQRNYLRLEGGSGFHLSMTVKVEYLKESASASGGVDESDEEASGKLSYQLGWIYTLL